MGQGSTTAELTNSEIAINWGDGTTIAYTSNECTIQEGTYVLFIEESRPDYSANYRYAITCIDTQVGNVYSGSDCGVPRIYYIVAHFFKTKDEAIKYLNDNNFGNNGTVKGLVKMGTMYMPEANDKEIKHVTETIEHTTEWHLNQ